MKRRRIYDFIRDFITYIIVTCDNCRGFGQRDRSNGHCHIRRRDRMYIHYRMDY